MDEEWVGGSVIYEYRPSVERPQIGRLLFKAVLSQYFFVTK